MSYNADQRKYHLGEAEKASQEKRPHDAAFHTAKAAEYTLNLAEHSEGDVARAYIDDANELIDFARDRRAEAREAQPAKGAAPKAPARESAQADADDKSGGAWQMTNRPNVKLDSVAGLDDVKKALRDNVIQPRLHPELYEKYKVKPQAGVLMYGPPGNGKTYIAKAVAGELDADFFAVDPSAIKSKWVGDSEKNVKSLFEAAARSPRAIIFIDECDALLSAGQNQKVNIFNQFLMELDGISTDPAQLYSRFILAATNKPWLLGDAVLRPGRLGRHIYVGLPDAASREAIVRGGLAGAPLEADLPFERVAAALDGFSGADIAAVCEDAKQRALARELETGRGGPVTLTDIEAAATAAVPSVTPESLAAFEDWREQRGAGAPRT